MPAGLTRKPMSISWPLVRRPGRAGSCTPVVVVQGAGANSDREGDAIMSPNTGRTRDGRNIKSANVLLWTAQGLLAGLFLFAGVVKLTMPIQILASRRACRAASCGSSPWPKSSARSA
jgi:hypothetical protein